ncbi:NAD(P)H-hydrate epimerase [Paracoccus sp. (in: a-proteobacteria)]|uniref:NAD(P)H-hydrate epimerase n=1 Tax=Paracoccus sp. TaxID=267 RepID=UPI0026DEC538|nr:NAD(P)H-hydrate epimerase [Paracoccus sp. (in: a-proteobacteria)]MDO5646419.1 NAD(P)H-hydrate epimerase [Paracoccus sp. (in: a-proteobacteria)]
MIDGTQILTSAEMRAIESAAIDSGTVTAAGLMERAGAAVFVEIEKRWPQPGRACVLCGPGHNGGDGYVIARLLARAGWDVIVLGVPTVSPDAAAMRAKWTGPVGSLDYPTFYRIGTCDLFVDAVFGTGLTRPLDGEIGDIMRYIGGSGGDSGYFGPRVVAVDGPSGLCLDSGRLLGQHRSSDYDPYVRLTVTFDSPKPGHLIGMGPDLCGELVVADIGLESWRAKTRPSITANWPDFNIPDTRRYTTTPEKRAAWLTKHDEQGHKYTHGHAVIVSGGVARGGAARLAARGALRIGAGLVTLAPPRSALMDAGGPDALMRRGVDDADAFAELMADERVSAICLGPGCGVDRAAALLPVALASKRPLVLDADAITAWADSGLPLHGDCVLTPHAGEFARAFPDLAERWQGPPRPGKRTQDPTHWQAAMAASQAYRDAMERETGPAYSKLDAARDAAARCGAVVVLKGADTVIATGYHVTIHSAFDVPWLATAGSGDVLAGIITGLMARRLMPSAAAKTGVQIHGAAARRFGPGLIADDLPDQIPGVFRDFSA